MAAVGTQSRTELSGMMVTERWCVLGEGVGSAYGLSEINVKKEGLP